MLTGAALALALLYLQEDGASAGQGPLRGGAPALEDGADTGLPNGGTSPGRGLQGEPEPPLAGLFDSSVPQSSGGADAPGLDPAQGSSRYQDLAGSGSRFAGFQDLDRPLFSGGTSNFGGVPYASDELLGQNRISLAENLPYDELSSVAEPLAASIPTPMFVLVQLNQEVSSRSVDGLAQTSHHASQAGVVDDLLDLRAADNPDWQLQSDQLLRSFAFSVFDSAEIKHDSDNTGLLNSIVLRGDATGSAKIRALESLKLGLFAPGELFADVSSRLVGMQSSRFSNSGGDDSFELEASKQLTFTDGGQAEKLDLNFVLLNEAMVDSVVLLGPGNNKILVSSGIKDLGFSLDALRLLLPEDQRWNFYLQARSVGLDHSVLDSGAGDDQVLIDTYLNAHLPRDLGAALNDPSTTVQLERIGLLNSTVYLGAGNDDLQVTAPVLNSTVDLGTDTNTVLFNAELRDSRIVMGEGSINQVTLADTDNSAVLDGGSFLTLKGGAGDDWIELETAPLAGDFDGYGGINSVLASTDPATNSSLLTLTGKDQGKLDGINFRNFQNIDMGEGSDQLVIQAQASLAGELLAGEGDDSIYLQWSPWLAPATEALKLSGGAGNDLFVFSGLGQAAPGGWDKHSGIPILLDLEQIKLEKGGIGLSDRLAWVRQELLADGSSRDVLQQLTPSGLEGLGDVKLLPIAPLADLLAGITGPSPLTGAQLAIGTTDNGAELLLLNPQGGSQLVADMPGFHQSFNQSSVQSTSTTSSPLGS